MVAGCSDTSTIDPRTHAETIEAIRQLALPGTTPAGGDDTLTVGEAMDTIEARIRRAIDRTGGHEVYVEFSERLERLRRAQLDRAEASVAFLQELLEVARQVTAAERTEEVDGVAGLDLLPDAKVGALTQILAEYAPDQTPQIIRNVADDIDTTVSQVSYSGWQQSQPGDRQVRVEIRTVLPKHGLPAAGELFDRAYAYVAANY